MVTSDKAAQGLLGTEILKEVDPKKKRLIPKVRSRLKLVKSIGSGSSTEACGEKGLLALRDLSYSFEEQNQEKKSLYA